MQQFMRRLGAIYFSAILSLFIKPVESVNQVLIDLPSNATWNQTAVSIAGDGSPSSDNAHLSKPQSFDIYSNGSILVSDYMNRRVIRFDPGNLNGTVILNSSLICGNSQHNFRDLCIGPDQSIYISCGQSFVERWLPGNTRSIVAGNGTPGSALNQLNDPDGVFVDSLFSLYVADRGNGRVVLWATSATQGEVLMQDSLIMLPWSSCELFIDEANMMLYMTKKSSLTGSIIKISLVSKTATILASRFSFTFTGIIVDKGGRLYVVERTGNRILRFEPNSSRSQCIAACSGSSGSSPSSLNQPSDIRFDHYGNLIVSDTNNNRVQKFLLSSNLSTQSLVISPCARWSVNATTILGDANGIGGCASADLNTLCYPQGLAIDEDGQVHVADCGNNRVLRITSNGSVESISAHAIEHPSDIVFDQNQQLYVLESGRGRVLLFPPNSINASGSIVVEWDHGNNSGIGPLGSSQGCTSAALAINNDATVLYISEVENHRVTMWLINKTNGTIVVGEAENATDHLNNPQGILLDALNRLWIADSGNDRIVTWINGSSPTVQVTNVTGVSGFTFDSADTLYIVEEQRNQVSRWRVGWNDTECILACNNYSSGVAAHELNGPQRVQMDSLGNLIVTDTLNHRTQKFFLVDNSPCESSRTATSTSTSSSSTAQTTVSAISNDVFVPVSNCSGNSTGAQCEYTTNPCVYQQPCENNGTCQSAIQNGYTCQCAPGYLGDHCQYDQRLCRLNCFGHGDCFAINNQTDIECQCDEGWYGKYCEKLIDNCPNVTCENGGICDNTLLDYVCLCASTYYSGRYCEISSTKLKTLRAVSTTVGVLGWISIVICMSFIITMDCLKYGMGVDPVDRERRRVREAKKKLNKSLFTTKKSEANLIVARIA